MNIFTPSEINFRQRRAKDVEGDGRARAFDVVSSTKKASTNLVYVKHRATEITRGRAGDLTELHNIGHWGT